MNNIINFGLVIQKPMEKSYWVLVREIGQFVYKKCVIVAALYWNGRSANFT